ncbi:hypothetical protein [Pseudorhodobacter sp.]|uniref:hypothetical protein n=1 Tax=Pseudorhodobacter sp. TaxID=1934400 RepID=UPI0026485CC3|nr:hypothetical protein [Pseudorhodobacter sp.]MDN5787078.1 hypothetical protein [Pseudorhodobacter sp.]
MRRSGNMEGNLQQFIPGIVEGQRQFYFVPEVGPVERHWLVPGTFGPRSYGPAIDHPFGSDPTPAWYAEDGTRLARDPREGEIE